MPHKFTIASARSGEFVAKFVYNAETLVWSETYTTKASAKNCIASLQQHGPSADVVDEA